MVCPHCQRIKAWEVKAHVSDPERPFGYPLPCECDGAKQAEIERLEKEQRDRDAEREVLKTMALRRAGLTGRLAEHTLDSFERRKSWPQSIEKVIAVRKYWQAVFAGQTGHKPWLVLYGKFGTGKTHLAAAVIREAISAGWTGVYFRSWSEHLARLQASWDNKEQKSDEIARELRQGALVAIDDIDKRESRGWAQGELYRVLNHRYNAKLPTILTFNCAPIEPDPDARGRLILERYMGRACIDRIVESAFMLVNFDGPSYRSGIKW